MSSSLPNVLRHTAAQHPDRPAIRHGYETITYGQLIRAADRLAAHLRKSGTISGDVVATVMPNSAEHLVCYYAAQFAGAAIAPLNPALDEAELTRRLLECGPRVLLLPTEESGSACAAGEACGATLLRVAGDMFSDLPSDEQTDESLDVCSDTVATLTYAATGSEETRAVELSQASLARAASILATTVLHLTPDDVLLSTFPVLSVLGQTCGINATVAAGASLAMPERFDAEEILRVIAEHRVTVLAIFPALLPGLLREANRGEADLSSVRTILGAGGTTVPIRLVEPVESTFGCELLQCYGPPGSAGLACATTPGVPHRPGSVGPAVDGIEVRVHGGGDREARPGISGELLIRGPHVMQRYLGDEEASSTVLRNGWLHTGNEARMDPEGYVYLLDGGWIGRARGPKAGRTGRLGRALSRLRRSHDSDAPTPADES